MADEGVIFRPNSEVGTKIAVKSLQRDNDAVLLCTGATNPRGLPVPGHKLLNIHQAMDFLTKNTQALLEAKDGQFELWNGDMITAKDKDVVVIGGGDTGTDCIATSLRHGCKSLVNFELMPEPPDGRDGTNPWPEWPRIYRVDYGHSEAKLKYGRDPREYCVMTKAFIDDGHGKVKAVKTVQVEWTSEQPQDQGLKPKWKLKEVKGSEKLWPADLVVLSLGFLGPEQGVVKQMGLQTDKRSNIQANYAEHATSQPGIFAAGDCRRGQSLVVWAINEGRLAADCVHDYLGSKGTSVGQVDARL